MATTRVSYFLTALLVLSSLFELALAGDHWFHHRDECRINGAKYARGAVNPGNICQMCDNKRDSTHWVARPNIACDDHNPRTYNSRCNTSGQCVGTPYSCADNFVCARFTKYDGTGVCKYNFRVGETCRQPTDVCDVPVKCVDQGKDCPAYVPPKPPVVHAGVITQPEFIGASQSHSAVTFTWSNFGVSCGDMQYIVSVRSSVDAPWVPLFVDQSRGIVTRTLKSPGLSPEPKTISLPLNADMVGFGNGGQYQVSVNVTNVHGRYLPNGEVDAFAAGESFTTIDYTGPNRGSVYVGTGAETAPFYLSGMEFDVTYGAISDDVSGVAACDFTLNKVGKTHTKHPYTSQDPVTPLHTDRETFNVGPGVVISGSKRFDLTPYAGAMDSGDRVQVTLRCFDKAGNPSPAMTIQEMMWDATPPKCPEGVHIVMPDGQAGYADMRFSNRDSVIRARFRECIDDEFDYDPYRHYTIAQYQMGLYDVTEGKFVSPMRNVTGALEITWDGDFKHNHTYVARLTAENKAGLVTDIIDSPPLLVDLTLPVEVHVEMAKDNDRFSLITDFSADNKWINASFPAAHDPESGIDKVCYLVRDDASTFMNRFTTDCIPLENNATSLSLDVTETGAFLIDGRAYQIELRTWNRAGSMRAVVSNRVIVDSSAPVARPEVPHPVFMGDPIAPAPIWYISSFTEIPAKIMGIWDPHSGVRQVDFSVNEITEEGTRTILPAEGSVTFDYTNPDVWNKYLVKLVAGNDTQLKSNIDYELVATVFNGASVSESFKSPIFRADITPPLDYAVHFGEVYPSEETYRYSNDTRRLPVFADVAVDNESPIVDYTFTLDDVTPKFEKENILTVSSGAARNVVMQFGIGNVPLLVHGHTYRLRGVVTNAAGLTTTAKIALVTIDLTPPEGGEVWIGASALEQRKYQTDATVFDFGFGGFTDPESGIDHYHYTVSSDKDAVNVYAEGTLSPAVTQVHLTDLELKNGEYYYVSVQGVNPLGMLHEVISETPVFIDTLGPEAGYVCGGLPVMAGRCVPRGSPFTTDHAWVTNNTHVLAHWSSFHDIYLDVDHYTVCVGSESGKCDIIATQGVGNVTYVAMRPDDRRVFEDGDTYYVTVTAVNLAGTTAVSVSHSISVDSSTPSVAWQRVAADGSQPKSADVKVLPKADTVFARIAPAVTTAPVVRYRFCLQTVAKGAKFAALTPDTEINYVNCSSTLVTVTGEGASSDFIEGEFSTATKTAPNPVLDRTHSYRFIGSVLNEAGLAVSYASHEFTVSLDEPRRGYTFVNLDTADAPVSAAVCMAQGAAADATGTPLSTDIVDFDFVTYTSNITHENSEFSMYMCNVAVGDGYDEQVDHVTVRFREGQMTDVYHPRSYTFKPSQSLGYEHGDAFALNSTFSDFKKGVYYLPEITAFSTSGLYRTWFAEAVMVVGSTPVGDRVFFGENPKQASYFSDKTNIPVFYYPFHNDDGPMRDYTVELKACKTVDCGATVSEVVHTTSLSASVACPNCVSSTSYYVHLTGCNMGGICSTIVSEAGRLADTGPVAGTVSFGTEAVPATLEYINAHELVNVYWKDFEGTSSSITEFRVGLGATAGQADYTGDFVKLDLVSTISLNVSTICEAMKEKGTPCKPMEHGKPIIATIKAIDATGLSAIASSPVFHIASKAPVLPAGHDISVVREAFASDDKSVNVTVLYPRVAYDMGGLCSCKVYFGSAQRGTQLMEPTPVDCHAERAAFTVSSPKEIVDVRLWASVVYSSCAGITSTFYTEIPVYLRPTAPPALDSTIVRHQEILNPAEATDEELANPGRLWDINDAFMSADQTLRLRPFKWLDEEAIVIEPLTSAYVYATDMCGNQLPGVTVHGAVNGSSIVEYNVSTAVAQCIAENELHVSAVIQNAGGVTSEASSTIRASLGEGEISRVIMTYYPDYFPNFMIYSGMFETFTMLEYVTYQVFIPDFPEAGNRLAISNRSEVAYPNDFVRGQSRDIYVFNKFADDIDMCVVQRRLKETYGDKFVNNGTDATPLEVEITMVDAAGRVTTRSVDSTAVFVECDPVQTSVKLVSNGAFNPAARSDVGPFSVEIIRDIGTAFSSTNIVEDDCSVVVGFGINSDNLMTATRVGGAYKATLDTVPVTVPGTYTATLVCPEGLFVSSPVVYDPERPHTHGSPVVTTRAVELPGTGATDANQVTLDVEVAWPLFSQARASIEKYHIVLHQTLEDGTSTVIKEWEEKASTLSTSSSAVFVKNVKFHTSASFVATVEGVSSTGLSSKVSSEVMMVAMTYPHSMTTPTASAALATDLYSMAGLRSKNQLSRAATSVDAGILVRWTPFDPQYHNAQAVVGTAMVHYTAVHVVCQGIDGAVASTRVVSETETYLPIPRLIADGKDRTCHAVVSACTVDDVCAVVETRPTIVKVTPTEFTKEELSCVIAPDQSFARVTVPATSNEGGAVVYRRATVMLGRTEGDDVLANPVVVEKTCSEAYELDLEMNGEAERVVLTFAYQNAIGLSMSATVECAQV